MLGSLGCCRFGQPMNSLLSSLLSHLWALQHCPDYFASCSNEWWEGPVLLLSCSQCRLLFYYTCTIRASSIVLPRWSAGAILPNAAAGDGQGQFSMDSHCCRVHECNSHAILPKTAHESGPSINQLLHSSCPSFVVFPELWRGDRDVHFKNEHSTIIYFSTLTC